MAQFRGVYDTDPGPRYEQAVEDAHRFLQKASDRWSMGSPSAPLIEEALRQILGIFVSGKFLLASFRAEVDPYWLACNDGTVEKVALGIYEDRAFDRLPILGDALEEAGCADADILGHCREAGPHGQGCWVVELLLETLPSSSTFLHPKPIPRRGDRNGRPRGGDGLLYEYAFERACGIMDRAVTEWVEGDPEDPLTGKVLKDVLAVFIDARILLLPFGAGPT